MRTYSTRQVQSKTKEILDAAAAGEEVRITRGKQVFKVLLVEGEPTESVQGASTDDLLAQLVEQTSQQTDLLRQLVEQKDTTLEDLIEQSKPQALQVADPGKLTVTARVDEEPQRPVVVIPERLENPEPEPPGEPSQEELRAAHEYFGLRETPDGMEVTQKGIQSALVHMKKVSRDKPDSVETQVIKMDPASDERIEFIRLYQLDRYSGALAKRAGGDPKWLGMATPPRF
ncbi:type II toxin-antitoxin system Phd/YefM family antitoxin [Streptomyces prasinus]|uniref:type II toxin-antitoxin system Phd/YefM family antitoxin n=1 Tax=Streptomyces prasinus TaxID=67345 RepID=UPI0033B1E029